MQTIGLIALILTLTAQAQERVTSTLLSFALGERSEMQTPPPPCADRALLMLQARDPVGYRIYQLLRDSGQEGFFYHHLRCHDPARLGLTTAVHEGVHALDYSMSSRTSFTFNLGTGGVVVMPLFETFAVGEIARSWSPAQRAEDGRYYDLYLSRWQSAPLYALLTEINSYTHGLRNIQAFADRLPSGREFDQRDSLAHMLYYLELYFEVAAARFPEALQRMVSNSDFRFAVQTLWRLAKEQLLRSCAVPTLGFSDSTELNRVFSEENLRHLAPIMPHWREELRTPLANGCPR